MRCRGMTSEEVGTTRPDAPKTASRGTGSGLADAVDARLLRRRAEQVEEE